MINNGLSYSIFHKPSYTDKVIHCTSMHPQSHKLARLFTIPLSSLESELNIIKQIAVTNGYESSLVGKLVENILFKKAMKSIYPNIKQKQVLFACIFQKTIKKNRKHFRFKNKNICIFLKTNNTFRVKLMYVTRKVL